MFKVGNTVKCISVDSGNPFIPFISIIVGNTYNINKISNDKKKIQLKDRMAFYPIENFKKVSTFDDSLCIINKYLKKVS